MDVPAALAIAATAALAMGCGRLSFETATSTDADADAAPQDASCTWSPFGPPQVVFAGTNEDDWLGGVSRDDQSLLFARFSGVSLQEMWIATRNATGFINDRALTEINSVVGDKPGTLTTDGTLWFSTTRGGTGSWDLWTAQRGSTGTFTVVGPVNELNTTSDEDCPALSPDGLRVYFIRSDDIWRAERTSVQSSFSVPVPIAELNTSDKEIGLAISDDEREVFFASLRPGGLGNADLYTARRATRTEPFGVAERLTVANTPFDDSYPSLSSDGTRLYLNRDTTFGGGRDADVWIMTRTCD